MFGFGQGMLYTDAAILVTFGYKFYHTLSLRLTASQNEYSAFLADRSTTGSIRYKN